MIELTSPMLAASLLKPTDEHTDTAILAAMHKLKKWPVMATLKKDGIRGIVTDTGRSRRLKLIPNNSIRQRMARLPYGYDMELWNKDLDYNEIESIVMSDSHERSDEIQFHVLDRFDYDTDYIHRIIQCYTSGFDQSYYCERPTVINDADDLFAFFIAIEQHHGEGICFRTPDSPYKQGRSTLREQYLVKLSRYVYSDCLITGFEEQYENMNAIKRDGTGRIDRSSCEANLRGKETLGAVWVQDENGLSFRANTMEYGRFYGSSRHNSNRRWHTRPSVAFSRRWNWRYVKSYL